MLLNRSRFCSFPPKGFVSSGPYPLCGSVRIVLHACIDFDRRRFLLRVQAGTFDAARHLLYLDHATCQQQQSVTMISSYTSLPCGTIILHSVKSYSRKSPSDGQRNSRAYGHRLLTSRHFHGISHKTRSHSDVSHHCIASLEGTIILCLIRDR